MKSAKIQNFLMRRFEQPFRKLTISDRAWVDPLCWADGNLSSHVNFPMMYMVQEIYPGDLFRKFCGCVIKKPWIDNGILYCQYPIGRLKNRIRAVKAITRLYAGTYQKVAFWCLSEKNLEEVKSIFGEASVTAETSVDYDNYILDVQEQIHLEGPQYHNRRKKIARFNRAHNWTYEPITKENMDSCLEVNEKWFADHADEKGAETEQIALKVALRELDELKLQGGLFRINGKPAAIYIGTPFNKEVYLSLFMKADNSYPDISLVFTHEFFKRNCQDYRYDNEGCDDGLVGLRKFKTNMHPVLKVPVYDVMITDPKL